MKKTFSSDAPRVLSEQGPLLAAVWSADKDAGMTSRTFPGQRKFPVSLFKGSHCPLRRAVSGVAQISPQAGRQARQRQAGGAGATGSCPAAWDHICP